MSKLLLELTLICSLYRITICWQQICLNLETFTLVSECDWWSVCLLGGEIPGGLICSTREHTLFLIDTSHLGFHLALNFCTVLFLIIMYFLCCLPLPITPQSKILYPELVQIWYKKKKKTAAIVRGSYVTPLSTNDCWTCQWVGNVSPFSPKAIGFCNYPGNSSVDGR